MFDLFNVFYNIIIFFCLTLQISSNTITRIKKYGTKVKRSSLNNYTKPLLTGTPVFIFLHIYNQETNRTSKHNQKHMKIFNLTIFQEKQKKIPLIFSHG